jgi:hypothetical protein
VTEWVDVSPPGVVTVSVPEKNAPGGQSMSEVVVPGSTSPTPKVAVTVPPTGMPEPVELQLRLGVIGCAVAKGSIANNPSDKSDSIEAALVTCMV